MAHFAEIDQNNVVLRVLVIPDEQEHRGQDFLANDLGLGGQWVQTSYNTFAGKHLHGGIPLHKNFAGVGFIFDGIGFHRPKPFPSWTFDEETYIWQPPVPLPDDHRMYQWDEDNQTWVNLAQP